MSNATVARLAGTPNIVGIKDATGNLERGRELIGLVGSRMAVYSGDDATAWELILAGARGNISVTANVAPRLMSAVCEAALDGKTDLARQLNEPLEGLHKQLFVESNPIPVKWALQQMGRIQTGIRLPLTWLTTESEPVVKTAMQQAGLV